MALCAYTVRKAVANAIVWLSQDVNKQLALRSPSLIKLLLEALLLDPDHDRQGQSDEVKSAIQRDAAQCFMQLATFGPGREVHRKTQQCSMRFACWSTRVGPRRPSATLKELY